MLCKRMARPKEFDRNEVLTRAIEVFADRGFEGASTDVLLKAMGIGRQSFYDTYGSKRQLYLEALRRYNYESAAEIARDIVAGPTPLDSIEYALVAFAERVAERPDLSCLGVGSICEFGIRDDDVLAARDASGAMLMETVKGVLERGKVSGQVRADIDPETAADLLLITLVGIRTSARAGIPLERLRQVARLSAQIFT